MFVTTSILTQNLFNANVLEFATGKISRGSGLPATYNPSSFDSVITLPEIFGIDSNGGKTPFAADPARVLATVSANARANFVPLVTQTIGAKIFFKMLNKATSSQRSFINGGLRMVGIKEVKV
jgi:hypothetical protein